MKALACLSALCLGSSLMAAPIDFDFKDPKGVNNVAFSMDAPLESISGTASGISGKVTFDPQHPDTVKGKIVLEAGSLHVGNPMMKEHMHGKMWMDVAANPSITFELDSVKNVKTTGNETTADAVGKLSMKGVTKEITVPVKFTYLKDKLKTRGGPREGDLLVVRSQFKVKRTDFGINAGQGEDKVSNEIDLRLSLAGAAPK